MSDALIDRKNVERLAQEFHDCDELPTTLLCLCDRIEKLEAKLAKAMTGLNSIASNTCCDKCQEAALVARTTLAELTGGKDD